jgi:hypothetical protein
MRACGFPGCTSRYKARGYCQQHWRQLARGETLTAINKYQKRGKSCSAQACWHPVVAKGLCQAHYKRKRLGRLDWSAPLQRRRSGWFVFKKTPNNTIPFMVPRDLFNTLKQCARNRGVDVHEVAVDILQTHFKQLAFEKREMARLETLALNAWERREDSSEAA